MDFNLYEEGKELLRNKDNLEWLDKIICWVKEEPEYNIYIFQVIVDDQLELEECYEKIAAAIAVEFQAMLKKAIEKWNIYLVFECKKCIDWKIKLKVEKDKYAVRKIVWDNLGEEEINSKEYLRERLFGLSVSKKAEKRTEEESLLSMIKKRDLNLYEILQKEKLTIEEKTAIYMGDGINE